AERTEAMPAAEAPGETPAIDPSTLPDIDSLGRGSDFSPFMQAGVPPALKIKALRKLWRVKPELANLDGLIDYGEDLTGSFKVVDQLKTAYEVGRGFLRDPEDEVVDKEEEDSAGKEVVGEVEASESPQTTETHRAAAGDTDEAENVSAGHESTDKV
ncbi:MAG: DUF3306 domain-containing protein, partial [Alphaproteobacteria bacterium]|nr:DUF3306 domain-containing protein [Alphaproteobacteria bacterium]